MKQVLLLVFTIVMLCGSAVAQKNDISEAEYRKAEAKAEDLIKTSNYRMERKGEFFPVRGEPGRLSESDIKEVILPNKWRTVEIRNYDGKTTRSERLWDGNALYIRENDGKWEKFSGGGSGGGRIESGRVTTRYRYLGKVDLQGRPTDLYELESLRIANKASMNDVVVVRYVRKIRSWYAEDGRLIQKIEESTIEGREELSRETTTFEYDPNINIEAPIK